jgi:hypothetical protein
LTLPAGRAEDGFAAIQWVVMISFAMVLLLMIANVIAFQYGGGAIRAAVDEGARWGAALGRTADECAERADRILRGESGLLRGGLGESIVVTCGDAGGVMVARATGQFDWWVGGLPKIDIDIEGRSVVERPVDEPASP